MIEVIETPPEFELIPDLFSREKMFTYSKLFNYGLISDNKYIKLYWRSKMIRAENDVTINYF
jgi:hypothetical protein